MDCLHEPKTIIKENLNLAMVFPVADRIGRISADGSLIFPISTC